MLEVLGDWIHHLAGALGTEDFIVAGTIAIVLVSLICGSVGALVVGNRMAFFSDALAHCAFAGVALGIILAIVSGLQKEEAALDWVMPLVMIASGVLFGVGIAYVRERTDLGSDTVIGVFFAGALGLGALLIGGLKLLTNRSVEVFMFGSPNTISIVNLLWLAGLTVLTAGVITLRYNQLVFASFNPSLARSRRIPLRLYNYLLIVLLALIVNICLQAVGILLINAMLVVPAATAINLSRNLRQMYWWTILLSLATSLGGYWISYAVTIPYAPAGPRGIPLGTSGCIVLLAVAAFAASMFVGPRLRRQQVV